MKITSKTVDFAGRRLTLETGKLAKQATAAVLARLGDTVVLATVVASSKETTLDYFPLSVEYIERLYAGGIIKGSRWVKREGRPTDEAVLIGRLIDRSIRPLFPKEYKHDVQVIVTVLSIDGENEPDILAINAVSAALAMSPIPWKGPVAAIRIGHKDGEYLANPGGEILASSDLDVVVSQSKDKTVMIEAGALQVPEDVMMAAIEKAHIDTGKMLDFITDFAKEAKVGEKIVVEKDPVLVETIGKVEKGYKKDIENLIELQAQKENSSGERELLVDKVYDEEKIAKPDTTLDKKTIAKAVEAVFFKTIRANVIDKDKRADGRKLDEIRPLTAEVGVLPRTHGSAIFQRGDTQALTVATLGSTRMEQLIESAAGEVKKRYIHHYSFPPYSVGETGRVEVPSRREIGHGALAERALEAVIPSSDVFPYTIRMVSELLSSNGSTSMASTCGSTLALMDAGVPITKPVAGISVGMMSRDEEYKLLLDIIGLEDFSGDMDFKVAGTDTGITAIQLDVKNMGLTVKQIKEIFEMAKNARMKILEVMEKAIATQRAQISMYEPKITLVKIPVDKIGELIGPGGKNIKAIMAKTNTTVDVDDDGSVSISGPDQDGVQSAVAWISGMSREIEIGETFEGEVKRILPFGAFVEFLPGKEGMVHVSKMSTQFVTNPNDVVKIGQKVTVRVVKVDEMGRIDLSMISEADEQQARENRPQQREFTPRSDFKPRSTTGGTFQTRSEHPLARQFQRENRQQRSGGPGFHSRGQFQNRIR